MKERVKTKYHILPNKCTVGKSFSKILDQLHYIENSVNPYQIMKR